MCFIKSKTQMKKCLTLFVLIFSVFFNPIVTYSQACDSLVPSFVVDLSSKSDSVWLSPATQRDGFCCGAIAPYRCIEFKVTVSPAAIGIIVHIYTLSFGPVWLVNFDCIDQVPVDDTLFFPTSGPYSLTICNPGNTVYQYEIKSIPTLTTTLISHENPPPIIIYPNPASDCIIIDSQSFTIKSYLIIDAYGKIIQSGNLENKKKIKLESLSAGLYLIELISDDQLMRYKIIKK